ncbi:hypothetical protein AVEN_28681-1 [Araneus ventricosus]|uniref:Uncharacterized protein n=1 Tax=Araneus ventricosus TaxID=182803 RepID=A0A4Y2RFF5_ARAVE|nr:hypothetical protein AVEN_28681-1 [Araneus ventricosus]
MREKGVIKSISNLSNRQKYIRRKQWKKDSRNYRKRKSLQQAKETRVGSRGSPRIQSGRKAAKHIYSSLRYKLQSMIAKSLKQARKIENLRKENYRLKSKDKSKCSLSPATKVRKLIGRKKMSPEIRKNLLLNFAFMSVLEENKKVFKKEKERRYIVSFLLDSSIGLFIIFIGIRLTQHISRRKGWDHLVFGEYGKAPYVNAWLSQCAVYIMLMLIEKIFMTLIIQLKFWDQVRKIIMSPIKDPKVEVAIVVLIVPFIINVSIIHI